MSARLVPVLVSVAGAAALIASLVAAAMNAIERELAIYLVEVPDVLPDWVDDGSAL